MQSLASAARLLARCNSAAAARPLLEAIGFARGAVPLSPEHAAKLGIENEAAAPHLARGIGGLRCLVFETPPADEFRAAIGKVAHRLEAQAPQLFWLVLALDRDTEGLALAAIDTGRVRPRVATLVVQRSNVVDSDAETVCALAAANTGPDVLIYTRWLEILGRESVTRRFFRALEDAVSRLGASLDSRVAESDARELAILYVSRMLFLSFLETKGWLARDYGFLTNRYADCMAAGGRFHQRVLAPLFFGTLNTTPRNRAARARAFGRIPFLNGGLFSRSHLERRAAGSYFSDDALGELFGELLTRYRFTAREDSTSWSEAAIDPEMLGKAFESLMSAHDRKRSGAFYTPQSLVTQVSASVLSHALASPVVTEDVVAQALGGAIPSPRERQAMLRSIDDLRFLDPACGSGAFLVHILEELSRLRLRLGDLRPLHAIRRLILTSSIFGVDVNPTAVWLCELRLWLSMAIEDPERDPMRVTPLPNLDRNIRIGDSLSGDDFNGVAQLATGSQIARIRARYSRATGPRKATLARTLDRAERECAIAVVTGRIHRLRLERSEILASARARDLFGERPHPGSETRTRLADLRTAMREAAKERRRINCGGALPFSFPTGFADVAARGGFDAVIGNPPWIRTGNLDSVARESLRRAFAVYRSAAWTGGSEAAAAGRGFASQVDAAALFVERSVNLLRSGGTVGLIVPAKLWKSLAGGGVRNLILKRTQLCRLHDLSSSDSAFDAAVYPSIIVARKTDSSACHGDMLMVAHRGRKARIWTTSTEALGFDDSPGSPWILVPDDVRKAFDRISLSGVPLARTASGRPLLGVKTGCNDAFLITADEPADMSGELVRVSSSGREGLVEQGMLRPVIRGERVTPWRIAADSSRIIWTHDERGRPLERLPPATLQWLSAWRRDLELRTDARGKSRWWSVFRTDSADFSLPRVVWSDIGKSPRAAVIPAGDPSVPINSCYVLRCQSVDDALALAALVNSDVAAAWLDVIAEPARGGYSRYMGWTMALLPVPKDWVRARETLAPLSCQAMSGLQPDARTLRSAVLSAFRLEESDIAPLLEWRG